MSEADDKRVTNTLEVDTYPDGTQRIALNGHRLPCVGYRVDYDYDRDAGVPVAIIAIKGRALVRDIHIRHHDSND